MHVEKSRSEMISEQNTDCGNANKVTEGLERVVNVVWGRVGYWGGMYTM